MSKAPLKQNEYVTIAVAAVRLATNEARIRQWIHRKDVARRGRTYLFRQLVEIEYMTRHPEARRELTKVE